MARTEMNANANANTALATAALSSTRHSPATAARRGTSMARTDMNLNTNANTALATAALALLICLCPVQALDNGLGLTPPLGWRSYNAFGGGPTQADMESTMDAMVDKSRKVGGKPTSLLDLGYIHVRTRPPP